MVKKDTERRILKINHNRFNSLAKLDPPSGYIPGPFRTQMFKAEPVGKK